MAIGNLSYTANTYDDGLDSIAVRDVFETIRGGRTLDMTGYTGTGVLRAGHIILRVTASGQYRPMPITGVNSIGGLGVITPGTGYTPLANGAGTTYAAVALTGGTGTGATADITITNGGVTAVVLVSKGTGYAAGDVLSAAASGIGNTGAGFTVTVASVNEGGAYGTLPAGTTYAGILVASIPVARPFAAIMVRGNINPVAAPYDFATVAAAFTTATNGRITAFAD